MLESTAKALRSYESRVLSYSLWVHSVSIYCVLGAVAHAEDPAVNKTDKYLPSQALYFSGPPGTSRAPAHYNTWELQSLLEGLMGDPQMKGKHSLTEHFQSRPQG